jgi:hypothetical protein
MIRATHQARDGSPVVSIVTARTRSITSAGTSPVATES